MTRNRRWAPTTSRRDFLGMTMAAGFGAALGWPTGRVAAASTRRAPADAVIQIFLRGGLSHIDSFDPKPEASIEIRGPYGTVPTPIDGVRLSSLLGRTAAVADRLVVIRSMTHGEAAHERGTHNMLTGYRPTPAVVYPSLGAVAAHELESRNDLPPYVCIPSAALENMGTGYLGAAYGPFSVAGEPSLANFRVRDLSPPKSVDDERLMRRRRLLDDLDAGVEIEADAVAATESFYERAYRLIQSPTARAAFDVAAEPNQLRNRYGRGRIGQRLLLARRLVEAGSRYVTVLDEGYDTHEDLERLLRPRLEGLDQGFSALIDDLSRRGLLDRVLVVLTTEFGRTPRMNARTGRDHWPKVFSSVLAGGGLRGGVGFGLSTADGSEPALDPVRPGDLAATVFHQLGVDPAKRLMTPTNRPIEIVRDGRVLTELIA